jgi:hypothetical protein
MSFPNGIADNMDYADYRYDIRRDQAMENYIPIVKHWPDGRTPVEEGSQSVVEHSQGNPGALDIRRDSRERPA